MNAHDQRYKANAYHFDLGNEMAHGDIWFDSWTMHFQSERAPLDFALQDLQVQLGENGEHLRFTHPAKPGWTIYVAGLEILNSPVFKLRTNLREQVERINQQPNALRKLIYVTLGVVAAFLLMALLVFQLSGWMLNYLVDKVPTTFETKLGDDTFNELRHQADFVTDKKRIAALTALGQKVLPSGTTNKFRFRYHIVDYPDPNAFALPGGNVIVTTALLDMLSTEELAGVLAHESAHVIKRHGLRHIIANVGPYLVLSAFFQGEDGFLAAVSGGAHLLITQNFSQQFETEADDTGWDYLVGANINPHAYIDSLEKLRQHTEPTEKNEIRAFSSHPATIDRIKRLKGKWATLKSKTGFIALPDLPPADSGF